jgi:hypothetical protein
MLKNKSLRALNILDKPSIWLHTAYQVWYVCFQGKARLLQHTNCQLETFWTLQVRVVILDDGLYLATWYTMDDIPVCEIKGSSFMNLLIFYKILRKLTDTASSASFLDLCLEFDDSGQFSTKIYNDLYKFNKTVLSAPQSVLDTNFKILRALRLLFFSILIWGRKVSLLSKRRP